MTRPARPVARLLAAGLLAAALTPAPHALARGLAAPHAFAAGLGIPRDRAAGLTPAPYARAGGLAAPQARAAGLPAARHALAANVTAPRKVRTRRFMLGIEGLGLMVPALRPRITSLDARYLGNSVTLGGVGIVGRWQVVPRIALELGVRSGSLRYRNHNDVISQDMVLAEAGALLYLLRGEVGHLALDGGAGGLMHAIRYELRDRPDGAQIVGGLLLHVGVDLEIRLRRIAFTAALRSYGVVSDVARTRTRGTLFDGVSEALRRAPVAVFQTYLLGSVGIAYRF